MNEIIFLNR